LARADVRKAEQRRALREDAFPVDSLATRRTRQPLIWDHDISALTTGVTGRLHAWLGYAPDAVLITEHHGVMYAPLLDFWGQSGL
jgi:hypothetical protein